jgi:hypothetical protein
MAFFTIPISRVMSIPLFPFLLPLFTLSLKDRLWTLIASRNIFSFLVGKGYMNPNAGLAKSLKRVVVLTKLCELLELLLFVILLLF